MKRIVTKQISTNYRFTVLPAGKVPEPPTPRRNSLTRRNAFCSLETYTSEPAMGLHVPMTSLNSANRTGQAASLELEQEEDTKSMGSNEDHGQKHHLSLHNMTDYHTLVKSKNPVYLFVYCMQPCFL